MVTEREKTVCFTGHRGIPSQEKNEILYKLYSTVMELVGNGYDTFICGGAVGFDTFAAECVVGMRERFPNLRLILALPCRDQTGKWDDITDLTRYKTLLGKADGVEYCRDFYTKECMFERNRLMVDNSSVCVAYLKKKNGGTAYTCRYAEKQGIKVINLSGDTRQLKIDTEGE